jgi:predicted permease
VKDMDPTFIQDNLWIFATLVVWELGWKAIALWRAARKGQRNWFIALIVLNTVGILPIVYLMTHRGEDSDVRAHAAWE